MYYNTAIPIQERTAEYETGKDDRADLRTDDGLRVRGFRVHLDLYRQ